MASKMTHEMRENLADVTGGVIGRQRDTRSPGISLIRHPVTKLREAIRQPLVLRQRRLSSERPQMTRDQFVRETASTELGKLAAAQLWDKLSALKVHDEFTPYPSDNLLNVYGLAEEDLDVDIIMDILKKLNCAVPDQVTVDAIGAINTPTDVVRFVEVSCPHSAGS